MAQIHYLIVIGNEFGATGRQTFHDFQAALDYYENVKNDDFHKALIEVGVDEKETIIMSVTDEKEENHMELLTKSAPSRTDPFPLVRVLVEKYFEKNWRSCGVPEEFAIPGSEERAHIIDIATTVKLNTMGISTNPGSFVKDIVDNNLKGAFANADRVMQQSIRFILTMDYNMSVDI